MKVLKATKSHITDRQRLVLDFIVRFLKDKQYCPTEQEIADGLKTGRSNIQDRLNRLEEKGYIARGKRGPRNIIVLETV